MNEDQFALDIARRLNHGLSSLSPETTARLAAARAQALARQKRRISLSPLAAVGNSLFPGHLRAGPVLSSFAMLLSIAIGSAFWVADLEISEMSAIDSELLADELPMGAFADKGFNLWIKHVLTE